MKKTALFQFALLAVVVGTFLYANQSSDGGHCPMCGRRWDGNNMYDMPVPETLPTPQGAWLEDLNEVLALERLSKDQYMKDSRKFNIRRPYGMVIPQEENHIAWITDLYNAFGVAVPDSVPPLKETSSAQEALQAAMTLEQDLVPIYESLIRTAGNEQVEQVINEILLQTRMHYTMFQHALSMEY
ncbi:MAG: hypothetical protein ACLFQB_05930 [Chitinispirillaceae bacterium]